MKRIILIIVMFFIALLSSCSSEKEINLDSDVDSMMEQTSNGVPSWNKEGLKGKWN